MRNAVPVVLLLSLSLPAMGHQDPRGEVHPRISVRGETFFVSFDVNDVETTSQPISFTRTYSLSGELLGEVPGERFHEAGVGDKLEVRGSEISRLGVEAVQALSTAFVGQSNFWFCASVGAGRLDLIEKCAPHEYLTISTGLPERVALPTNPCIGMAYDIDASTNPTVILGHPSNFHAVWQTENRLSVRGITLLKWTRHYEGEFDDIKRPFQNNAGKFTWGIGMGEVRRDLTLFLFDQTDRTLSAISLGQPCAIYDFLVCSNVIRDGDQCYVAWVDLKHRLLLSACDLRTGTSQVTVVQDMASWNTSLSLARVGKHLLVAWHQVPETSDDYRSKVQTKHLLIGQE